MCQLLNIKFSILTLTLIECVMRIVLGATEFEFYCKLSRIHISSKLWELLNLNFTV